MPSVSIVGSDSEVLIGETGTFTVKFSNTGQKEGYGPYLALCLPAPGADGDAQGKACDGVTFVSASEVFTNQSFPLVPANPGTIHSAPGSPIVCSGLTEGSTNPLCGSQFPLPPGFEGCQIVFVELLHGSFYPDQPEVSIEIKVKVSSFADAGTALPIRVVGGFRFGDSPTGTLCQEGKAAEGQVTPSLFKVKKSYLGPEGETVTGPNFPRRYKIEADVANGQTLAPLRVTENLPDDLVYLGPYGPPVESAPPPGTADGTVVLNFDTVTGGPGSDDASFLFDFYAGKLDAQDHPVLDPDCQGLAVDDIKGEADWRPLDPRDPPQTVKSDVTPADHRLVLKCVAVQKTVAGPDPTVPGSVLTYTLDAQVSDFVQAGGLTFTDVLSDGFLFLTTFAPRLRVVDENGVVQGTFFLGQDAVADTSAKSPCGDGSTELRFDVAKALQRLGVHPAHRAGVITGGEVQPNPPSVAATIRIIYRARVQDSFDCPVPSGDKSVDKHDRLGNEVGADALVRGLLPGGQTSAADDNSQAEVEIASGQGVRKDVVARNGNRQDPTLKENPPRFSPGDTVTFRLRYRLPASDAEAFVLEDFLPSPVFRVQAMEFVPCPGVAPPPSGKACWGPASQIDGLLAAGRPKPCRNLLDFADPSRNSVCFDLGSFDDPKNKPRLVEILFTVTVTADPFADDLQLTDQVLETERNSFGESFSQTSILQIALGQPLVRVSKGAVATCCGSGPSCRPAARLSPQPAGPVPFFLSPACALRFTPPLTSAGLKSSPVGSDAIGSLEPGDRVLFALVVENRGSSPNGAFDVRVRDVLPTGMRIPAAGLGLCVANGAGEPLPFKDLGGGLFGSGLELKDRGPRRGALGRGQPNDPQGGNLAVITYVLEVGPDLGVGTCAENRAALASYAGSEGGASHVATGFGGPFQEGARACRRSRFTKTVAATSEAHTGFKDRAEELAIGEIVRFRITFEVPRGTWPMAHLFDPPPPAPPIPGLRFLKDTVRLAFVSTQASGLTATAVADPDLFVTGDETTVDGVKPKFVPPPDVNASTPQRLELRLGDLRNTEADCDRELVVVEVDALVENVLANQNGRELENRASAVATGLLLTSSPARLRVVEPLVQVGTACPEERAAPSQIVNRGSTDAFDVTFVDEIPLPFCQDPPIITVNPPTGAGFTLTGQRLEVTIARLPAGGTVIVGSGDLCAGIVDPPRCIVNLAEVRSTSLPGPRGTLVTGSQFPGTSGAPDGERNGDGGAVNTYRDVSACNFPGGADCLADLALVKTCSPGAPPTCSIRVTNLGPAAAGSTNSFPIENEGSFDVQDLLPSGARLVGASGTGWSCTGDVGTISCRYDDRVTFSLAPGEQAPELLLRIDLGGAPPADNCAQVAVDPPVVDPNPGNDLYCSPVP